MNSLCYIYHVTYKGFFVDQGTAREVADYFGKTDYRIEKRIIR